MEFPDSTLDLYSRGSDSWQTQFTTDTSRSLLLPTDSCSNVIHDETKPIDSIYVDETQDPTYFVSKYNEINKIKKQLQEEIQNLQKDKQAIENLVETQQKMVLDTLRLLGKNIQVASTSGQFSNLCKEESEIECIRIQSVIDEKQKEFDECLQKLQKLNTFFKTCISTLPENERHNFENPYLCGVCCETEITYVFRPCGHTVCQGCYRRGGFHHCHICRTYINDKVKIYFS